MKKFLLIGAILALLGAGCVSKPLKKMEKVSGCNLINANGDYEVTADDAAAIFGDEWKAATASNYFDEPCDYEIVTKDSYGATRGPVRLRQRPVNNTDWDYDKSYRNGKKQEDGMNARYIEVPSIRGEAYIKIVGTVDAYGTIRRSDMDTLVDYHFICGNEACNDDLYKKFLEVVGSRLP